MHEGYAPYPHPNPSSGGRGLAGPFSHREKVPKGRMRVRAKLCGVWVHEGYASDTHPNPSPGGRGALSYFFTPGKPSFSRCA